MFKFRTITTQKDPEDMARAVCEAANMSIIGQGYYADVYGREGGNRVYKVFKNDSFDDGYITYLRVLSEQNEHNPYTPKIYGVWEFRCAFSASFSWFLVSMEKLEKDEYDDWMNGQKAAQTLWLLACPDLMPKHKDTYEQALTLVHEAYQRSSRQAYDIHGGNLMLRGKQVVITDPLI